jgi:hypothetical protein
MTWSRFHTQDPHILGASVQNKIAMVTWGLEFLHLCFTTFTNSPPPQGPILNKWIDLWRWDRLIVPKRRYRITPRRRVMSQKSADLINVAAEAWNHGNYDAGLGCNTIQLCTLQVICIATTLTSTKKMETSSSPERLSIYKTTRGPKPVKIMKHHRRSRLTRGRRQQAPPGHLYLYTNPNCVTYQ